MKFRINFQSIFRITIDQFKTVFITEDHLRKQVFSFATADKMSMVHDTFGIESISMAHHLGWKLSPDNLAFTKTDCLLTALNSLGFWVRICFMFLVACFWWISHLLVNLIFLNSIQIYGQFHLKKTKEQGIHCSQNVWNDLMNFTCLMKN